MGRGCPNNLKNLEGGKVGGREEWCGEKKEREKERKTTFCTTL